MKLNNIFVLLLFVALLISCTDSDTKENDLGNNFSQKDSLEIVKREKRSEKSELQNQIDSLKKELGKSDSTEIAD